MKTNTELKFKDLTFERNECENPVDGKEIYWTAMNPDGEPVAYGWNKKECIKAAREYVRKLKASNEEAEADEQEPETVESTEVQEPQEEQVAEPEINAWLMGYIPKKKQPAILTLTKTDDGYSCRIGNGYIVNGQSSDMIHEAKWKEFLKVLRNVEKVAA